MQCGNYVSLCPVSRPINYEDLMAALRQVKASVSQQDLDQYEEWDKRFGASK